ncbi:MAG TPA: hypothetical protein VLG50_00635 [Candidatus Saccharimonadales bacterium]|nr:hypothetical protein [Candidatus Saccharimonadales bacterium]
MKYIVTIAIFHICIITTHVCLASEQQRALIPFRAPGIRPIVRRRLPLPIPRSLSQIETQPKIIIFDAGIVEQKSHRSVITFRNFPEIILSYTKAILGDTISFQAYEDNICIPIISSGTDVDIISDCNIAYRQEPNITIEANELRVQPPHFRSTACIFEWPDLSAQHIFFVYRDKGNTFVEYMHRPDEILRVNNVDDL